MTATRSGACLFVVLLALTSLAAIDKDVRLVDAAKRDDKPMVRSLLKQRVDVNVRRDDGSTPLMWVTYYNDLEAARLLIAAGADLDAANDYGETPLFVAARNRSIALVVTLLEAGANPNTPKRTGETVLMAAARTGEVDIVRRLIARGADVNARETVRGQTALMWAVARKHLPVAEALIAAGANVHAPSTAGSTPLHFAIQQSDVGMTRRLLAAGAEPDARMTVRQIDQEVQPFVETLHDVTPLSLAISICRADSPELATSSVRQQRPLYISCPVNEELGAILLEGGADPNAADGYGISPLHAAVQARMTKLTKLLLGYGAAPNAPVPRGARPQPAGPPLPGGRTFFTVPVGATPFFMAARNRDTELMRELLSAGADPNLPSSDKTSPLMAAAGVGELFGYGSTRLRGAGGEKQQHIIDAVNLTLEQGGDVRAVNDLGQTALHGAISLRSNDLIQLLVDKGADVNARDKEGRSPLTIAERDQATARTEADRELRKGTLALLLRVRENR